VRKSQHLPASQPPTNSPSKKNQDDHHRDHNYVHTRLAAVFVENFNALRGIPLCYGCYAGTTKDVKSECKELARSILCDLASARWPQDFPERLPRSASLPVSPPLNRTSLQSTSSLNTSSAPLPTTPAFIHLSKLLPRFISTAT